MSRIAKRSELKHYRTGGDYEDWEDKAVEGFEHHGENVKIGCFLTMMK